MIKYNLIGKKFGKLRVIENMPSKNQCRMWNCKCDCGGTKIYRTKMLISGQAITCGCSKYTRAKKHGMANTKVYQVWFAMVKRTTNKKSKDWYLYGERGIGIDKKWLKFQNFWNDMSSSYKESLMLDRIDNSKGYYKKNCRWTDAKTQANNTRRNVILSFKGKKKTMSEWAREFNLNPDTLRNRLVRSKWSVERALITPIK